MRGTQNYQSLMLSTLFYTAVVEGALYYERDAKLSEPNALNTLYSSLFLFSKQTILYCTL